MTKVIYHAHHYPYHVEFPEVSQGERFTLAKQLLRISKLLAVLAVGFFLFSYGPSVWYYVSGNADEIARVLARPLGSFKSVIEEDRGNLDYEPRFDPNLPLESRVSIPSIKVDTLINEASYQSYEEALKKGVWRVPDFGTPKERSRPVILAAHRYGYFAWSNLFRRFNSFFNLPKVKTGDTVEIVWRQRKYVYEVYKVEEGGEITDYRADLILYTCKYLDSDERIFVYARLLEI